VKTIYATLGLPASGKSTWAKSKISENPGAYKRVNKDQLREMIDGGKWSHDNEKFILGVRDYIIGAALNAGKHVICDDTNLSPKHQDRLRQLAKQHGAAFEIVDFTHVSVEECIERDRKRPNYVGEAVIRKMWRDYLAPKPPTIEHDRNLPSCVIVDIDGTVALMNGRSPFDWDKVDTDLPNQPVCSLTHMIETAQVIYVSGRDESCREKTKEWLREYCNTCGGIKLFMRPAGDMRDDRIIKREIYEREIKGKYNVLFALDDRNRTVRGWRDLGLSCFQVADGDF
jgi:predicted kinase